MSEIDVKFNYVPLVNFKSDWKKPPKEISIIPVYHIMDSQDIYGMLRLNKTQVVTSFGEKFKGSSNDLESHVANSISLNSLGVINLTHSYILNNSFVAYSTVPNVQTEGLSLNPKINPIIFVNITVPTINDLNNTLVRFKSQFQNKMKGYSNFESDSTALIYLDVTELYYLMRFTTYKIVDESNNVHIVDIQSNGFPARSDITNIYRPNYIRGEIPVTENYDYLANSCPVVDFYRKIDISLSQDILRYEDANLPFMSK